MERKAIARSWRQWRYLAAQRSRRVETALALAGVGLAVALLSEALSLWQEQIRGAIAVLVAAVSPLGALPLSLLLGASLVVVAVIIYTVPLPKSHSYLATNPGRVPRVAVYLDAENQLSNVEVVPFLVCVRKFVGNKRADLVFFADAAHVADGTNYKELVKGGFRPVDVPHKRIPAADGDDANAENAVDIEMSLYAYQQALLASRPMDIVLVVGDSDYLPLIRRLWMEGHRVHVWARHIPNNVLELTSRLGIETDSFASLFLVDERSASTAERARHISRHHKRKRPSVEGSPAARSSAQSSAAAVDREPPAARVGEDVLAPGQLRDAFAGSVGLLQGIHQQFGIGKHAREALGSELGNRLKPTVSALGLTGSGWTLRWCLCLEALGVYGQGQDGGAPVVGHVAPEQGVETFLRFLAQLSESARRLAGTAGDGAVRYTSLRKDLVRALDETGEMAGMLRLLKTPSPAWPNPLVQLCNSAVALGFLRYTAPPDTKGIYPEVD